jgi:hypothetical protein
LGSSPNTSGAATKISTSAPPVSLRYLNEFVGKLHCAPALLQHGLFPDAKEVTEVSSKRTWLWKLKEMGFAELLNFFHCKIQSMALFNAVRRYIEPKDKTAKLEENGKHDGIVVVGDGNTREWKLPVIYYTW